MPEKMTRRPRPTYTDEQIDHAMALYRTEGAGAAARHTGINRSTLSNWAKARGITSPNTEAIAAAGASVELVEKLGDSSLETIPGEMERVARTWADLEDDVHEEWALLALEGVKRTRKAVKSGDDVGAQRFATVAGIATDKARLIAGEATGRTESVTFDATAEQLGELLGKIARRAGVLDVPSRPAPRLSLPVVELPPAD